MKSVECVDSGLGLS